MGRGLSRRNTSFGNTMEIIEIPANSNLPDTALFRFLERSDAASFYHFLDVLTARAGEIKGWHIPPRKQGEDDNDYKVRVAAEIHLLRGETLANVIMSANACVGTYVSELVRGVIVGMSRTDPATGKATIKDELTPILDIPQFMQESEAKTIEDAVSEWMDHTGLKALLRGDVVSRLKAFVGVLPRINRFVPVGPQAAENLVSANGSTTIDRKIRMAADVGRSFPTGTIPPKICQVLAKHLNNPNEHYEAMEKDLTDNNIWFSYFSMPQPDGVVGSHKKPIYLPQMVRFSASYKNTDPDTGEITESSANDILITGVSDSIADLIENKLKGIVEVRFDGGPETDGKRSMYIAQIQTDD